MKKYYVLKPGLRFVALDKCDGIHKPMRFQSGIKYYFIQHPLCNNDFFVYNNEFEVSMMGVTKRTVIDVFFTEHVIEPK